VREIVIRIGLRRRARRPTLHPMADRIAGIVLAAGRSTRMGRPKHALDVRGESFLEHALRTLAAADCDPLIAVVNRDARVVLPADLAAELIVNADAESEQIDSLRCALAHLSYDVAAVLVLPVDLPLVHVETARAVVDSFRAEHALIVAPVHGGLAGHPLLLARELFDELMHEPWEQGVRTVLVKHAAAVREVPVDDAGVLIDIDTPDDYSVHVEGR
jgi:molybdenum cofactor cytidylyltransferase